MDEELDLKEIVRIFRRRWRLIALFFLVSVVLAWIITVRMTPIYESTASILIDTEGSEGLEQILGFAGGFSTRNAIQNNVEILRSKALTWKVVDRLGLAIPVDEFDSFRKRINIQPVPNSDVIRITVQSPDRFLAKEIAEALVDLFEQQIQQNKQQSAKAAREFIGTQLAMVAENLREAEARLTAFKEREKIVSPQEETEAQIEKIVSLETMAAQTRISLEGARAQLAQLRRAYESEEATIVSSQTIVENPLVEKFRTRLGELEVELAGAREKYTDLHPAVRQLKAEIADIQAKLEQEVARIVGTETRSVNPVYQEVLRNIVTLETEIMGLTAREEALTAVIRESEERFASLPQKEVELLRLTRDQEVAQEIYLLLVTKQEEIRIQEAMKVSGIHRIDPPVVPEADKPVKPSKRLNVMIAGVLGLFAGVFLAFLIESLDTSIKTLEEVEAVLGLPVLGQIPRIQEEKRKRKNRKNNGHTKHSRHSRKSHSLS
jgi:succinoglycan biosynthesis transport protein ExoP